MLFLNTFESILTITFKFYTMKKSIFKVSLFALLSIAIVGCQNDGAETPETAEENAPKQDVLKQFVSVKDISNDPTLPELVKTLELRENAAVAKRVGCVLDGDIGCGGDAALEIEDYVNQSNCISYTRGTLIFPIQSRQFTYNYSYYIDGDSDINMDHYQYQFDAHVADIERRISPNKITFVSANASNGCYNERGWNVDNVVYTVILGN